MVDEFFLNEKKASLYWDTIFVQESPFCFYDLQNNQRSGFQCCLHYVSNNVTFSDCFFESSKIFVKMRLLKFVSYYDFTKVINLSCGFGVAPWIFQSWPVSWKFPSLLKKFKVLFLCQEETRDIEWSEEDFFHKITVTRE